MLLEVLVDVLKGRFKGLEILVNEEERRLTIPERSAEVGAIEIYDDGDELMVGVGNFTHWHASCFEDSLSEDENEVVVVNAVVEFLSDLFNEEIVMWGSHETGGGFYYIDGEESDQDAPLQDSQSDRYFWSGKVMR